MTTDINTTKTRMQRLLADVIPQKEPQQPNSTSKLLPTLLIITIIGTMLPFQAAMAFFSMSFVTVVLLSSILRIL